jgi:hypothetical protein
MVYQVRAASGQPGASRGGGYLQARCGEPGPGPRNRAEPARTPDGSSRNLNLCVGLARKAVCDSERRPAAFRPGSAVPSSTRMVYGPDAAPAFHPPLDSLARLRTRAESKSGRRSNKFRLETGARLRRVPAKEPVRPASQRLGSPGAATPFHSGRTSGLIAGAAVLIATLHTTQDRPHHK